MRIEWFIIRDPKPEDVGTITISAQVAGYNPRFTDSSFVEEFIDEDNDECRSKEYLNYFLMESGISDDDTNDAMSELTLFVDEVTNSSAYDPGCALLVSLLLTPNSRSQIGNIPLRPASQLVVQSLTRKKVCSSGETTCAICLEDFTNGERRLVTLPCGHDFDDECLLTWFKTHHTCPLCRFKLPCD